MSRVYPEPGEPSLRALLDVPHLSHSSSIAPHTMGLSGGLMPHRHIIDDNLSVAEKTLIGNHIDACHQRRAP